MFAFSCFTFVLSRRFIDVLTFMSSLSSLVFSVALTANCNIIIICLCIALLLLQASRQAKEY